MKLFARFIRTLAPIYVVLILCNGCTYSDEGSQFQNRIESKSLVNEVNSNDIPEVMEFIRSNNKGDLTFEIDHSDSHNNRNHEEDLVLTTVHEEQISQVINEYGKSSYTFKMTEENDKQGIYFINLNVKEYLDGYYMFFTKYVPDLNWLKTYNNLNDFQSFSGEIYFYDDTGAYLAKANLIEGISYSISKNNCENDSNNGGGTDNSTPGDQGGNSSDGDGDNSGSLIDDIEVSYGWLCNWRGQLHASPEACNNPGMGGTWTLLVDYGNGDKSMSQYLKSNCDDDLEDPCYNDVGDPCPNGCDENGNCIEDGEVENSSSGVYVDFEEIMALLSELNSILGENSTIEIRNDLSVDSTISLNSVTDFETFHENFDSSAIVNMDVIEESQNTKVNRYSYSLNNTLNSEIIFLVEIELPESSSDECLTVTDVTTYHSGSSLLFVEWDPDDSYNVFLIEETNETQVDLYGRIELGFSLEGISFTVSYLYLFSMQINNNIGIASGFTATRID